MTREWAVGTKLEGRWEIHRIMKGGMGVVYAAHDREWNEVQAAKTFQDEVFTRNPNTRALFLREAEAWVALDSHPNVARALFIREIEGKPVLFLEFVSGGDLSAWIGTARLLENPAEILRLAMEFCDGMLHAQAHGIVAHRDIKPQNCLITESGTLKITDFGLAKVLSGAAQELAGGYEVGPAGLPVSRTGRAAGTVTHMPPEQFEDAKHVGPAADIYSFGVTLFQMATGRLPFRGRSWEEFEHLHREEPPPIEELPAPFQGLVARCLAKGPEYRWESFQELRDAIGAVYQSLTGRAAPPSAIGAEPDLGQWLNKGSSLAALGLHQQAMVCYDRALAFDPKNGRVWTNRGNVHLEQDMLAEASMAYAKAIEQDATLDLAWCNQAITLDRMNLLDDALRCADQSVRLNPTSARGWVIRAGIARKLGRTEEAAENFERARTLQPRMAEAWASQASVLRRAGKLDRALECADRAVELRPELAVMRACRAEVLADAGRLDDAEVEVTRALHLDGNSAAAWEVMGSVALGKNDPERALHAFERYLELEPPSYAGWYNKALCLEKLARPDEAIEALDRALALDPTQSSALMRKGSVLRAAGRVAEAETCFEAAVVADPQNAAAWHNRAVGAHAAGRIEEALGCVGRALQIDPKLEEAMLARANYLADLARPAEALAAYEDLLRVNPKHAAGWFNKGATLGNEERFREALPCFEMADSLGYPGASAAIDQCRAEIGIASAVEPAPSEESAAELHAKGTALFQQGQFAGALACLDQAVAKDGASAEIWVQRAHTLRKLGRAEDALESCNRAVAADGGSALAWYTRGVLLVTEVRRYAEGLLSLEKALALGHPAQGAIEVCKGKLAEEVNGQTAASFGERGVAFAAQANHAEALDAFTRALALGPKRAEYWGGRGAALAALGNPTEAERAFAEARAINPAYVPPVAASAAAPAAPAEPVLTADEWHEKGHSIVAEGGDPEEALACFERAIELAPDQPGSWWGKAVCLNTLGRMAECFQAYEETIKRRPDAPGPWVSLGAVLYQAGRYEEAMGCYEQARELGDLDAWQGTFLCKQALGQFKPQE